MRTYKGTHHTDIYIDIETHKQTEAHMNTYIWAQVHPCIHT
jgi:hypothetical protein